jgi:hypothetical protein
MTMPRANYMRHWKSIRDSQLVARACFVRELEPLTSLPFRNLAAIDMKGVIRTLRRGTLLPADEMDSVLYAIFTGECQLMLVPPAHLRKAGVDSLRGRVTTTHAHPTHAFDHADYDSGKAPVTAVGHTTTSLQHFKSLCTTLSICGPRTLFGDFGIVVGDQTLALLCVSEVTLFRIDTSHITHREEINRIVKVSHGPLCVLRSWVGRSQQLT